MWSFALVGRWHSSLPQKRCTCTSRSGCCRLAGQSARCLAGNLFPRFVHWFVLGTNTQLGCPVLALRIRNLIACSSVPLAQPFGLSGFGQIGGACAVVSCVPLVGGPGCYAGN